MDTMSKIQADFDRLAAFDGDDWNHNNHYHPYLLRHMPQHVHSALEIGCGAGAFARLLARRADHVLALDLSPEMIRVARKRSIEYPNIEYQCGDVMIEDFPENHFDCIASIATLHHMPLEDALPRITRALKPGGLLMILDLFPSNGLRDLLRDAVSVPYNWTLKLVKSRHRRPSRDARLAWAEHGKTDRYLTLPQVRDDQAASPVALFGHLDKIGQT